MNVVKQNIMTMFLIVSQHWMPEHFKKFWDIDVPDYVKEKFNSIEL